MRSVLTPFLVDRTYLEENRDLFEVKREMEEGGYTEYQYDYNGKNLAQLIDECVRFVHNLQTGEAPFTRICTD